MTDHNSNKSRVVKQAFTNEIRFQSSATAASINVDPVNSTTFFGSQVANMANLYNEFRCVGIRVSIYPNQVDDSGTPTGANQTSIYLGYCPVPPASSPSTKGDICQLNDVCISTTGMSVPIHFSLGKRQLLGMRLLKWYHQDTTPNTVTDMQGRIFYIASGTNSSTWVQQWLVQSVWEFRAPVPFGLFLSKVPLPRKPSETKTVDTTTTDPDLDPPPGEPVTVSAIEKSHDVDYELLEQHFSPQELLKLKAVLDKT